MARITKRVLIILCCIISFDAVYGQLSFCEGDLGDPIFTEDFGTGTTNGPPLDPSVTTYTYVESGPEDGFYTISSQLQQLGAFHAGLDNTPDDVNGRAFIVNASFTADQFYNRTIDGLCENTSYEFSAFLQNLYDIDAGVCPNTGIPVNVRFQIWDSTDTMLLASGDTGNIDGTSTPIWTQYGLVFETGAGQTEVILKMINNGNGGCGNDLAIDDIVFRACGDITTISSDISGEEDVIVCNNQNALDITLTVTVAPNVFIQWQESTDGENWNDISGATSITYVTPGITTSTFYRVNTATDTDNLGNVFCSFFSNAYRIEFVEGPDAPISEGDSMSCDNEAIPALTVVPSPDTEIRWYASESSTEVLAIGASYTPETAGTFYAQAFVTGTDCGSTLRTPVTLSFLEAPFFANPIIGLEICNEQEIKTLSAGISNVEYVWSTGETTPSIQIETGGVYTVTVTNNLGCSAIKTFQVEGLVSPVISNVFSDGERIVIETENEGNFEYSLDGIFYRTTPVFRNVPGGLKVIFARNDSGCPPILTEFYHFNIPTFFTPNSDGVNDFFNLPDASFFSSSFIRVFDRFGKLLTSGNGRSFQWNGVYNGEALPPDDYWYEITIDDRVVVGHISLLR
ncbi:T9SS type B sorting domain-containing protein [uncultured Dokdonia sp.]|uniref:T9SS type B sorting domain-containing protein n=1 Tax=uncultured Dokdonia sp. TaxID=575653 RepID=UPI0026135DEF|nr:T9SS type B sorting domain-containing protein [uncultured Dokdonia sp.]